MRLHREGEECCIVGQIDSWLMGVSPIGRGLVRHNDGDKVHKLDGIILYLSCSLSGRDAPKEHDKTVKPFVCC